MLQRVHHKTELRQVKFDVEFRGVVQETQNQTRQGPRSQNPAEWHILHFITEILSSSDQIPFLVCLLVTNRYEPVDR